MLFRSRIKIKCSLVAFYFDPFTKSPISLLELGLVAGKQQDALICCPEGFWRKGNVELTAKRYGLDFVDNFDEFQLKLIKYVSDRQWH